MNGILFHILGKSSSASYSAGYQAILDRATALGAGYEAPSDAVKTIQNQLYIDLATLGLTSIWDVLRVYAHNGGAKFGLINWVDPNTHLATMPAGDLTFTSNVGFTSGNGTIYIDDNYNPSTQANHFALDDASLMYYKQSANSVDTGNGHIQSVGDTSRVQPHRAVTNLAYIKVNGASSLGSSPAQQTGIGLYALSYLEGDVTHKLEAWSNGVKLAGVNSSDSALSNGLRNCWYGNDKSAFVAYGSNARTEIPTLTTLLDNYLAELFFLSSSRAFWDFK